MAEIDIIRLEHEARVEMCKRRGLTPSVYSAAIDINCIEFRRIFAALVLEEAEKVCAHRMGHYTGGTIEWQAARMCRDDIRTIAEGLNK